MKGFLFRYMGCRVKELVAGGVDRGSVNSCGGWPSWQAIARHEHAGVQRVEPTRCVVSRSSPYSSSLQRRPWTDPVRSMIRIHSPARSWIYGGAFVIHSACSEDHPHRRRTGETGGSSGHVAPDRPRGVRGETDKLWVPVESPWMASAGAGGSRRVMVRWQRAPSAWASHSAYSAASARARSCQRASCWRASRRRVADSSGR